MIFMIMFIFIFNAVFAMGMKALLEDDVKWAKNNTVKIVLLIPPVAFVYAAILLLYGTIMTVYSLFQMYFKN